MPAPALTSFASCSSLARFRGDVYAQGSALIACTKSPRSARVRSIAVRLYFLTQLQQMMLGLFHANSSRVSVPASS